jgi:hypothetical protein
MSMGFAEDCLLVEGSTLMGAKIEVDEQLLYTTSQNGLMREDSSSLRSYVDGTNALKDEGSSK